MNRDTFNQIEALIRGGDLINARKQLGELNIPQIPRELSLKFANLCRRTDLLNLGLRILAPIVRRDRKALSSEASPGELSEYAVLLQKSGAIREALWILSQIDSTKSPETLLYRSFCHFNRWEYADAAELLTQYLTLQTLPYENFVGRVNLASALVALNRWDQAYDLLSHGIAEAQTAGYSRLQTNCLEMRAQVHFAKGQMSEARNDLNEATKLSSANIGLDQVLVRKWAAFFESLEQNSVDPILNFRAFAVGRKQWESVREADRFALKVDFERARYDYLRFGTPFERYREKLEQDYPGVERSASLLLGSGQGQILNLTTYHFSGSPGISEPTDKPYQLLCILLSDFYKPFALGGLFSELFPGEHFDVKSSTHRVRQIVYRTRLWIKDNKLPLEILEEAGRYSLKLNSDLGVLVPLDRTPMSTEASRVKLLRLRFGDSQFSSRQATAELGVSSSSFKNLIGWAQREGIVTRLNAGRAVCYRFNSEQKAA